MNVIIITGASSGIGREFALQMDPCFTNIDEFWLVARSREKLKETADLLRHKTRIFAMNITKDAQLERLEDTIMEKNAVVRMLINSAGYGIMGSFEGQDREEALGMIRLNCEALTNLTHRMIPYMRRGSRILQMASSAAFVPQPDFAVYAATKSYVLSFSRALEKELKEKGIYVTSICPGPVRTPFFDIAEKTGSTLAIKKLTFVSPKRVAALALRDSYYRHSLSVCSFPIRAFAVLTKLTPHEILLDAMVFLKKRGLY